MVDQPDDEQPGPSFAVVDTMLVSAILIGSRRPWATELLKRYRAHLLGKSMLLSFATVSELRYGSLKGQWRAERVQAMENWFRSVAAVVMPDDELVHVCARLRYQCYQNTLALSDKVHDSDRWIAATAIRHNVPLISDDKIFRDVPGLNLLQDRGQD